MSGGGFPSDVNYVTDAMAGVSLDGAAGAMVNYDQNVPQGVIQNPNGRTAYNESVFGFVSKGKRGYLRFHEFRDLLSDVFFFNKQVKCVFVAAYNTRVVLDYFDELYLSYLLYFQTDPMKLVTADAKNGLLFNANDQYALFKQYIVHPNLKYNGPLGFPLDIGIKEEIAKIWLKF
jgi:hypothetical protein